MNLMDIISIVLLALMVAIIAATIVKIHNNVQHDKKQGVHVKRIKYRTKSRA